jgi:hypothetical protein
MHCYAVATRLHFVHILLRFLKRQNTPLNSYDLESFLHFNPTVRALKSFKTNAVIELVLRVL